MQNLGRTLDVKSDYAVSFLIEQLKFNKKVHLEDYEKAVKVYNDDLNKALQVVENAIAKINEHGHKQEHRDNLYRKLNEYNNIKSPVNAAKTYDTYISLLNKTTSANIILSIQDANAIINDEWDWAIQAKTTNSSYSSRF